MLTNCLTKQLKAIFFTSIAFQAGVANSAPVAPRNFMVVRPPVLRETVQDSVNTSGNSIAGLTGSPVDARLRYTDLVISGLAPADKAICVTIERSSGLYLANFRIPNPGPVSTLRLRIDGPVLRTLKRYAGELAVKAQATKGDCQAEEPLLLVAWAETGTRPARINLLVNSLQADAVKLLQTTSVGAQSVSCTDLRTATRQPALSVRSFDRVCSITPPACGVTEKIGIFRRDGMNYRKREDIYLRGWC